MDINIIGWGLDIVYYVILLGRAWSFGGLCCINFKGLIRDHSVILPDDFELRKFGEVGEKRGSGHVSFGGVEAQPQGCKKINHSPIY